MYRAMTTFADRVICLTKGIADIARQTGLAKAPIVILPNGVEVDIFDAPPKTSRAEIRAAFGIPETAPLAVSLCVLRPEKALDRLLQAFPEVVRSQPDAHLLIVGDGPMLEPLTAMAKAEGLIDRVHFAGYRTDVADVMRASDIFVLPTMFDSQPTVIMEAMASRLPVVSTTHGGIPDMVDNGVQGTLVEPGNVPQLAHALADLMANPTKARAFGEAGRNRAVEEFAMDRQIERLAQLYDELIARRRRAA